jgi:hypothetical protein
MSDSDVTSIEEFDELMAKFDFKIPETPAMLRIRDGVADRRKNVASVEFKSEEWHRHRADAIEFCCTLIRQQTGQPAPVKFSFTPQFSKLVGDLSEQMGDRYEPKADPLGLAKAAQEHWQIAGLTEEILDQLAPNPALHEEFQKYLNAPTFQPARRSRGRQHKGSARNILIALMLESLRAIGWNLHQNDETEVGNSAMSIIHEAYCNVFPDESRNAQIKPKRMLQIWKDYQEHKKRNLIYLGTPLKKRAKGAADLISNDW